MQLPSLIGLLLATTQLVLATNINININTNISISKIKKK